MRLTFFSILVAALVLPSLAGAAGVGNPASLVGRENYGFTVEIEDQNKKIEGDPVASRRYLGRVIWGGTDWMDVYVRLGASDLKVRAAGSPTFRGSEGMTYGGGVTARFLEMYEPRITGLFSIQGLSYYSEGDIVVAKAEGQDSWFEKYDNRYRWSELQFSALAVWNRERWSPYFGLAVTNAFGEVRRDMYRLTDGSLEYLDSETNDFSEDALPEFVLGMDVALGGTGKLTGEIRIGEDDLSFIVGLSELYR